jgi:hypothetical protein
MRGSGLQASRREVGGRREYHSPVPGTIPLEFELLKSAAALELEVTDVKSSEEGDYAWMRVAGRITEGDVDWGALPLMFTLGAMSFDEAEPQGSSEIDYREEDQWSVEDLVRYLRYERGSLELDTDYVKGRMMKTRVTVGPDGSFAIEARGRGDGPQRWIGRLRGERQAPLLVTGRGESAGRES